MNTTEPITKQYIQENLLNKKGWLNGNKTREVKETAEELYLIFNNLERPKCECGNETTFISFKKGHLEYCSNKCSNNSSETKDKKKATNLKNYGVENPSQSKTIKDKKKTTCFKNHGVEYALQSKVIQEKKTQTCLKNHGVEYPMQSKIIQEKKTQTCLKNHGVEHALQSKVIQEKYKETNMKKLGVENPMQSKVIQEKYKETNMEKLGVDNPFKSGTIKEKSKATCFKNHGVENYSQTGLNTNSGYKYKDYIYPSGNIIKVQGYEPKLLDELILIYNEEEILTDRKDMPEFWYFTDDSKKHRYFPDVYIPKDNLIYEVKSEYTLKQTQKNGIYDLKAQSVIDAGFNYKLRIY